MKATVLGTGSWGTALAQTLSDNGNEVVMYGIDRGEIDDINNNRKNSKYFGDTEVTDKLRATDSLADAMEGTDLMLITVPTKFASSVLEQTKEYLTEKVRVVNAAKGFDVNTAGRMSDTVRRTLGDCMKKPLVSVLGPSHAEEVILRMPTTICSVSLDKESAEEVQHIFSNEYMRLYVATDEVGAEYGGAVKNVIAIASGITEGLGIGDNAKAALVTRGLREMIRIGTAHGAKRDTFFGLSGVGDLIVTCFSPHSRNFQAGKQIGRDGNAERFLAENKKTVEGIYSCKVIHDDFIKNGYEFDLPIIESLYSVLFEGNSVKEAITGMMRRPLKAEEWHNV